MTSEARRASKPGAADAPGGPPPEDATASTATPRRQLAPRSPVAQTLLSSTLAGVTASLVESYCTYPLEYLKTREQIALRPLGMAHRFNIPNLRSVFYAGSSAFALGNATKAVVRFNVYNWATKFMVERDGTASAPQIVVAGIFTGIAETLTLLPFENIKITMIEASALGKGRAEGALPVPGAAPGAGSPGAGTPPGTKAPVGAGLDAAAADAAATEAAAATAGGAAAGAAQSRASRAAPPPPRLGNSHNLLEVKELQKLGATVRHMYAQRGLRAFVQGFNPTIWRQVTTSGFRFTAYNALLQLLVPNNDKQVPPWGIAALAGATGFAEAAITQPIDVVKSRMQTTNGIRLYGNSLMCAYRIFTSEGPQRLWAGFVPRWIRVWISGGIIYVVYNQANRLYATGLSENPFSWE